MPRRPVFDEVWGERFQMQLLTYMEGLRLAVDEESQDAGDVEYPETLSGEPFCGCSDCEEREYLLMAIALALEGAESGQVSLDDAAPAEG